MNNILNLRKGDTLNLTKAVSKLSVISIGLGWDTKMDLDSIAFLLDSNSKIIDTVYFGNLKSQGIFLSGDSLSGRGSGDDEIITIDFSKLDSRVRTIAIYVNIFSFFSFIRKKDFSKVKNAFVKLTDRTTNNIVCNYHLTEDGQGFNAFHFVDIKRDQLGCNIVAVGKGCNGDIIELSKKYK